MKKISLPFLPISTNKIRIPSRGRLIKSPEARKNIDLINAHLLQFQLDDFGKTYKGEGVVISYTFYIEKFFKKDGTLNSNQPDYDNMIKTLQDCIFEKLGIDDSHIIDAYISKRKGEARTEIAISFI
jgi:Holliday junction resolvase RusA-like endonuclease